MEGRLEDEEELAVVEATAELLNDLLDVTVPPAPKVDEIPVLGLAADGAPDVLALRMLGHLLVDTPFVLDIRERTVLSTEIVEGVKSGRYRAVCIADIPPSAPSRSRAIVRRLRTLAPNLPVLVGRWAPTELADESHESLLAAGATSVAATLVDTRAELLGVA